jgi:hypothetical protein
MPIKCTKKAYKVKLVGLINVVRPGFEPRMTESKSVVLPLHHRTIGLQS